MNRSVWIESTSRWDAIALTRKLGRFDWFLVEPDTQHWDVCVSLGDADEGLLVELVGRVIEWLDERDLTRATLHLASRKAALG